MDPKKGINGIPPYVFYCLNKYGNTTVTKKFMKKVGMQRFVSTLNNEGFTVKIRDDDYDGYIIEIT